MRKIAIFGGTFNPIHNGHLHLCHHIATQIEFDKIVLIPSCKPPHKQANHLASDADRLAMCKLAVADDTLFEVSDLELQRQGVSYTVDTIRTLKQQYPNDQLYFLMGSDMLLYFDQWYCYEEILEQVIVVAGAREDDVLASMKIFHQVNLKAHPNVRILEFDAMPISSTEIRQGGQLCLQYLPQSVQGYIKEHGLYGAKGE